MSLSKEPWVFALCDCVGVRGSKNGCRHRGLLKLFVRYGSKRTTLASGILWQGFTPNIGKKYSLRSFLRQRLDPIKSPSPTPIVGMQMSEELEDIVGGDILFPTDFKGKLYRWAVQDQTFLYAYKERPSNFRFRESPPLCEPMRHRYNENREPRSRLEVFCIISEKIMHNSRIVKTNTLSTQ